MILLEKLLNHSGIQLSNRPTVQPSNRKTGRPENRKTRRPENRKTGRPALAGFTLIELLLVIAVMAVLLTLLAGGIKKSVDNAKKRNRTTECDALATAIATYWHDTGKPPLSDSVLGKKKYVYTFKEDNNEVFAKLIDSSKNPLGKKYLDINTLHTVENGHIAPMKKATDPIADYKGNYYKVTIDLTDKTQKVE